MRCHVQGDAGLGAEAFFQRHPQLQPFLATQLAEAVAHVEACEPLLPTLLPTLTLLSRLRC